MLSSFSSPKSTPGMVRASLDTPASWEKAKHPSVLHSASATMNKNQIEQIINALAVADEEARRKAEGKNLVLVLGNTGAGKSTFVNYLIGKTMIETRVPGKLDKGFTCEDQVMEIGFGFQSMTTFPQVYYDSAADLTYCDCPGFLDNRGIEFDISNMYAIARMAQSAKSVKGVVILINYHSLEAERAKGLTDTLEIITKIIGNTADSIASSIILVISNAPLEYSADDLRYFLNIAEECVESPLLQILTKSLVLYDPLDRRASPRGGLSRSQIVCQLQRLSGFDGKYLSVQMPPECVNALYNVLKEELDSIINDIKQSKLSYLKNRIENVKLLIILQVSEITALYEGFQANLEAYISSLASVDHHASTLTVLESTLPSEYHVCIRQAKAKIEARMQEIERKEERERKARAEEKLQREREQAAQRARQLAEEQAVNERRRVQQELERLNRQRLPIHPGHLFQKPVEFMTSIGPIECYLMIESCFNGGRQT